MDRIMHEDPSTKAVFRDSDGFLVILHVLSTLPPFLEDDTFESGLKVVNEALACMQYAFRIASEAIRDHTENLRYFEDHVGYETLSEAVQGLVFNSHSSDNVLGLMLCLAFHDFSISGLFSISHSSIQTFSEMDSKFAALSPQLGLIRLPGVFKVLWESLCRLITNDAPLRYITYKLLDHTLGVTHWNNAVLCRIGLVETLLSFFQDCGSKGDSMNKEARILQKLLKRTFDISAKTDDARSVFRRAVKDDNTLDMDALEIIRSGMKSRWPEHFCLDSTAALVSSRTSTKSLPSSGFTFMVWLWLERLPHHHHDIFSVQLGAVTVLQLHVCSDGRLAFKSSATSDSVIFSKSQLSTSRWTHITLVHHPHKVASPTIRIDSLQAAYPKTEGLESTYIIGDMSHDATMSWSIASSYFLSLPFDDDLPRFVHHLGPRYSGRFQDRSLIRFLTYEASTSLNMYLSTQTSKNTTTETSTLRKAVKDGISISESSIVFCLTPSNFPTNQTRDHYLDSLSTWGRSGGFVAEGSVLAVHSRPLDLSLWKIGGVALILRLLDLAKTSHELSRTIGALCDSLRNSWQNSEEIEKLHGYDIVVKILRSKTSLVNITSFETLFEFLGLNFRSPDHSTIVNTVAYRAIALDFELWSQTNVEVQRVHIEHFAFLLRASRFRKFNAKHRLLKMGIVRRFLFVLQSGWYQPDMVPFVINALFVVAQASFSAEDAIKPITSYLAANLHEVLGQKGNASPRSVVSHSPRSQRQKVAEQVLEVFVSTLRVPSLHAKFAAVLPLHRICLFLDISSSFVRKFDLIHGWAVLRMVLPNVWDQDVHKAAFDVLLGRVTTGSTAAPADSEAVVMCCPQLIPVILTALQRSIEAAPSPSVFVDEDQEEPVKSTTETLLEDLISLHSSSVSFRRIFKSQSITQILVDTLVLSVHAKSATSEISQLSQRLSEKLMHLSALVAMDNVVTNATKDKILGIIQAEGKKETVSINTSKNSFSPSGGLTASEEQSVLKSLNRGEQWRNTIIVSERKRFRKTVLDMHELRRQVSHFNQWTLILSSERSIWPPTPQHRSWRLDETEGPFRIRKKLEPIDETTHSSINFESSRQMTSFADVDSDIASFHQIEPSSWSESQEISSTETNDERQLAEDVSEDKHRRVRHELEPGDVIEAVSTVARVAGVDSSPGLLIFGQSHIYMLDGLVEGDGGEVIDAHDAPKRLLFIPGSIVELNGLQRAQRWSLDQLISFSDRTFLFRDVGLELFFRDSRSLLVVFLDKSQRQVADQRLNSILEKRESHDGVAAGIVLHKTPLGRVGAKVMANFRIGELSDAQRRWQNREISNFAYISILNQISGRTPSDATQYPIFRAIFFTHSFILTKPMGALTDGRREAAQTRYMNLESVGEEPFHYGTHFSSSMIVCHFLIRMAPYTNMFKTLQILNIFCSDIARTFDSASKDNRGDVRELIAEFFTSPEFLENSSNHDFGVQQSTGDKIHDVKLPPWAKKDPLLFVVLHRRALESDYVSENLPAWIDLIWGCKQRDPAAVNVFHPLSYEGSVDLDKITDDLEREATVGIIHNFGQTPHKLFNASHPTRNMLGSSSLPAGTLRGIEEDALLLAQESKPVSEIGSPVGNIAVEPTNMKIYATRFGILNTPMRPHEQVQWVRSNPHSLRLIQIVESVFCTCAAFADTDTLVTGSSDYAVRLWQIIRARQSGPGFGGKNVATNMAITHTMRAHTAKVLCVAASRSWSIVVSGSKDGSAALWDLNRGIYTKSIWHKEEDQRSDLAEVHLVAINESTGYIATCSRAQLCLHTINARPIAKVALDSPNLSRSLLPSVTSLAFHEREYSQLGVLATGGPDGAITLRTWNADGTPPGEKAEWEFVTITTLKHRPSDINQFSPC
ncbi:hypothetical protein SERLADRAFT_374121 [Serpula lacrymans var. lacrymans S7.9]|uniref:Beach-domain-containing protein n=1 Tax=Serpula lacrymans var. lacrymans (strain S7.9) TaxID=578457 RepID=F8PA79_SERL9|nr:uncharacterized protein SERLADRAFT_374121 [Serpula lacrymans var. lacrymans S7.9]EGO20076.1 hypothetical protein SERLADRAFT_374121 [Serpula lacrymans var. lacrymans S7.9]